MRCWQGEKQENYDLEDEDIGEDDVGEMDHYVRWIVLYFFDSGLTVLGYGYMLYIVRDYDI